MSFRESAFLTVADARRMGLLKQFAGRREITMGFSVFVERPDPRTIRFHAPIDVDHSHGFPISDPRFWRVTDVQFSSVSLKFGQRLYFHCPVTGMRCFKLFFYKGNICSKPAFPAVIASLEYAPFSANDIEARSRLLKMGATKRWSKRASAKIFEQAARLEGREDAVDEALAKEKYRHRKYEEFRLWECREASTSKALDCGRGLVDTLSFDRMSSRQDDWFADPVPAVHPVQSESAALLSDYGELDVRVLIDRGALSSDQLVGRSLGWPSEITEGHFISMYMRPRLGEVPQLIMEIEDPDGSLRYQDIALLARRDSARPRYFLCPVDRIRTDVLYFRNGIFASRSAHFLRYPPGGKIGLIREMQKKS